SALRSQSQDSQIMAERKAEQTRRIPDSGELFHSEHAIPRRIGGRLCEPFNGRGLHPIAREGISEHCLDDRQDAARQNVSFNAVDQIANVAPPNLGNLPVAPLRQYMHFEPALLQPPAAVLWLGYLVDPGGRHSAKCAVQRFRAAVLGNRLQNAPSGLPGGAEAHRGVSAKFLIDDLLTRPCADNPRLLAAGADAKAQATHIARPTILVLVLACGGWFDRRNLSVGQVTHRDSPLETVAGPGSRPRLGPRFPSSTQHSSRPHV